MCSIKVFKLFKINTLILDAFQELIAEKTDEDFITNSSVFDAANFRGLSF